MAWDVHLKPGMREHPGFDGAVTAIPEVFFLGGEDGRVSALSNELGLGGLAWEYDTVRRYKTVNGIAAHGGSVAVVGPTVAGGMVFVASGYFGINNGKPGNVILAFSPSGDGNK